MCPKKTRGILKKQKQKTNPVVPRGLLFDPQPFVKRTHDLNQLQPFSGDTISFRCPAGFSGGCRRCRRRMGSSKQGSAVAKHWFDLFSQRTVSVSSMTLLEPGKKNKFASLQSGAEVTSIFCDHYRVVAGKPMRGGHIIVTSTQYSYGIYPKTCCSKKVGISIFLCKVAHALISQNQN